MNTFIKRFVISILCFSMLALYIPAAHVEGAIQFEPAAYDPSTEPDAGGAQAHGSGSYQLNSVAGDYRFYTEYYVSAASGKKFTTAGIERRTSIQVYAKADEVILFGSSVSDSYIDENNVLQNAETGKDIVITTPVLDSDGNYIKEWFDVIAPGQTDPGGTYRKFGHGYIANPTQEKNGPMVNHSEESAAAGQETSDYYVPLTYTAPVDGIYTFEFHSKKGKNDGQTVKPVKASQTDWDQKEIAVAAWDVTVLGKNDINPTVWEVKSGRAWANYLALTTGGADDKISDLNVHVLSHDGYVYKVDFQKAVPFGFIFFANNTGFMTTVSDGAGHELKMPVYHSFYDSNNDLDNMANENITFHKPNEPDTDTEETYKIFFNAPSSDLPFKTVPDPSVTLTDLKFTGISETENVALVGHGGLFTFNSTGEATISISLDLRKAIFDSGISTAEYEGSGIVEITAFAHPGANSFYWDGKDTDGNLIPAGIYGNNNVVIASEVKRGELHFPVIDMEGLYDGLKIERLTRASNEVLDENGIAVETGESLEAYNASKHNLYYNNNPLAYGTIEGNYPKKTSGSYNVLSDGTKSFNVSSSVGGWNYFKNYTANISTLVKDDKEYLSQKLFGLSYADLSKPENATMKAIIDAEFGVEKDTFHFEPVDSSVTTMKFSCGGSNGGGNQAGIDAWTYYSQGISHDTISFAMLDGSNKGKVTGQIFYDGDKDSVYTTGAASNDYPIPNVKVRLIDSTGAPLSYEGNLPQFDESGHFIYNTDGTIYHKKTTVYYETVTDSNGVYRFTGVPYDPAVDTKYYVQVLLNDTQTEVLRYTCTTSDWVKANLISTLDNTTPFHGNTITADYGPDGCKMEVPQDTQIASSKIYGYIYSRAANKLDVNKIETVFDNNNSTNIQAVTFYKDSADASLKPTENGIRMETFKKIGYSSAVPLKNQWDYTVKKEWEGTTHHISDGLTVELWVWNDSAVKEENEDLALSRRRGALIDTQVINEANGWTYTWKNLDNRLQYYVLEYYTKKKANGDVIYNDKGEPRMVLIGGTMPIFSEVPSDKVPSAGGDGVYTQGIYGFKENLGDYPDKISYRENPSDSIEKRILIQYFNENDGKAVADHLIHSNSITDKEKLESVENNARQYNVTYKLSYVAPASPGVGGTNIITLNNNQVYDDRTYYVWLDHETELPDMIGMTYVNHEGGIHQLNSHAIPLKKDGDEIVEGSGEYRIKGLSVSSLDAADVENKEGNATNAFRIKADNVKSALFTATEHGNYKTGTGTRTYKVKYVVNASGANVNEPVSVTVNSAGKLVTSGGVAVEDYPLLYTVYSWYMTIHVYNVVSDGVIDYDPDGGDVNLQTALANGSQLSWELIHEDAQNENKVTYKSNDTREGGILDNDIYRVPLYKSAEDPHMGTCADLVGIAYAEGSDPDAVDVSSLEFIDTYESRFGLMALANDSDGGASRLVDSDGDSDDDDGEASQDGIAIAYGNGGYVTINLNTHRDSHINRTQDHANYADVTFTPQRKGRAASTEDVFFYKIVVHAEDSTYSYTDYDKIDASEGVVMYTYFTMKPTKDPSGGTVTPGKGPGSASGDKNANGESIGRPSPKTGDDSHFVLWILLIILAVVIIGFAFFGGKITSNIRYGLYALGGVVLLSAGYMVISHLVDYRKANRLYEKTSSEYVTVNEQEDLNGNEDEDEREIDWKNLVDVDLINLREENEDIVGWLYFENVDISYPILYSEDDDTYLKKAYTGENLKAGSIFMEGLNNCNFDDVHTIIYGHNMKNLSMFGKLKYYLSEKDYLADHEYFQIITEQGKYRYEIISCKIVEDDDDIYTVYHYGGQEFMSFVEDTILKDNKLSTSTDVNMSDHLITLSTCYGNDRLVVSAIRCRS